MGHYKEYLSGPILAVVKRPNYTLFSLTYLASSNFRDLQKWSRKFYETS